MHVEPSTFASATEMLYALRGKKISAVELIELHLQQIERYNPQLNAVVTLEAEMARKAAFDADQARARGEAKPLLGLPVTVKDCIDVAGMKCTGGVVPDRVPERDAPIIAKARAAGIVFMGKTNVPPWAADCQSGNELFGVANNPWDQTRTPGGSSGGSAAALASGMTPLEFGGDFAGSIRVPAAFCGVYGHRPSESALSTIGHFPGKNVPLPGTVMPVMGPMARSAEDLRLAFDVVAGPEIGEDVAWRLELPPARHQRLQDFRVAMMPPVDWLPVDHEIVQAQTELGEALRRLGATVKTVQPEGFDDLCDHHSLAVSLMAALTGPPEKGELEQIAESSYPFSDAYVRGKEGSADSYFGLLYQREMVRQAYRAFFHSWDVLITPANVVNAFPHQEIRPISPLDTRTLVIDDQTVPYWYQDIYAVLSNVSGQPATAFPVGQTQLGLPIGLQAIGPYLEDYTPIHFAGLVEQEFGGFHKPAGF
ncbi:MAG: amidase family protein [Chloroflexota bacterium]